MESLRNFYNVIIDKSGSNHIDMLLNPEEKDTLLCTAILTDMETELSLLEPLYKSGNKTGKSVGKRLHQIYRTAFLISELSGKPIVSYEESLEEDQKSEEWKAYMQKARVLFKKELGSRE